MSPTQQFIEDAVKGGWFEGYGIASFIPDAVWLDPDGDAMRLVGFEEALLDPKCWQAVGKTREWNEYPVNYSTKAKVLGAYKSEWLYNQHRFIEHLADGKTIDEALSSL